MTTPLLTIPEGFKPLLCAKDFDLAHLSYPQMVTDKYDGIRNCQLPGMGGRSRKLEPIPNENLRAYFDRDDLAGLDGEFIYGEPTDKKVRQNSNGAWQRHGGPTPGGQVAPLVFYVFDDFTDPTLGKWERYERYVARVEALGDPWIKSIYAKIVHTPEEAYATFKDAEARGFEGTIMANLDAPYKFGRDSAPFDRKLKKEGILTIPLLTQGKVKSFVDAEAKVIGWTEEMHNGNEAETDLLGRTKRSSHKENKTGKGRLGAWIVEDPAYPKPFRVGGAMTHAQREEFWLIKETKLGAMLTYKTQPSGMDVVPQFCTFVDFRPD